MKDINLTNQEKLNLLRKTKEIYIKQYSECLLNNLIRISEYYEPLGLCGCFYRACNESGYFIDKSYYNASNIIPEWNRMYAYQAAKLDWHTCRLYSSLCLCYWFPIWDKVNRIVYLNCLINKYSELSTNVY